MKLVSMDEGPHIESLTHRLAKCPAEFLAEPLIKERGVVNVAAVVCDTIMDLGGALPAPDIIDKHFTPETAGDRNHMRLVLISTWLCHDIWFVERAKYAAPALEWLKKGLGSLSGVVSAELFVTDPDRREELARLLLSALGLTPKGETAAQASGALQSLDSVSRANVIRETREKEKKARELKKKMDEKRAREAAAKASREW